MYDESKRFAESAVHAYVQTHGLTGNIARIFNTYGPNMQINDGRVVTNFIYQALHGNDITIYGTGEQTRSFIYRGHSKWNFKNNDKFYFRCF